MLAWLHPYLQDLRAVKGSYSSHVATRCHRCGAELRTCAGLRRRRPSGPVGALERNFGEGRPRAHSSALLESSQMSPQGRDPIDDDQASEMTSARDHTALNISII